MRQEELGIRRSHQKRLAVRAPPQDKITQPPLQLSPSKRPLSHAEPQPTCMQLKRTKWCSFVFLTMDRNMTKKMMRGANWEPK